MLLGSMLSALVDLVLPRACVGCGRAGPPLCATCRPQEPPLHVWAGGLDVSASGAYEGPLRSALIAYKEHGRHDLAAPLGRLLAQSLASAGAPEDAVLVPVPSSAAAARERGGDHVLRLARAAARERGQPVVPALRLARAVQDSAGLSRADRAANLRGAMVSLPQPGPGVAVIVDDIVTTGATVREARRALAAAGWTVGGAAAVASTPRHAAGSVPLARSGRAVYRGGDLTE
jgi:predicted amidophosphoribosyltransferase